jgi:hypothetical protein
MLGLSLGSDAAEADTFSLVVVQDFDGVVVQAPLPFDF